MDRDLREQLKRNFRREVFDVLDLISSEAEQLNYRAKVPAAHVSSELFNQWEDCYQIPKEQGWYQEEFSEEELAILKEFDSVLEVVANTIPQDLPDIHEFVKSQEWGQLSSSAIAAISKLRKI